MGVREPTRVWNTVHAHSRAWSSLERRPGDIVISTPPKSGTTWMQGVVASLLWPAGDGPADLWEVTVWFDMRLSDDAVGTLDAQEHRRFIKTHSPGDAIPVDSECRYLTVYRDPRDVLVSWANHRRKMQPFMFETMNERAAADGVAARPPVWNGDYDQLLDEFIADFDPVGHLASWWGLREEPYVLLVHFADLSADLEGEMRRIADFLEIEIAASDWPAVVERCHIDAMREAGQNNSKMSMAIDGGASSFFHSGTNGRWRDTLSVEQLARLDDAIAELPPDAAEWMVHGSLALGQRP